MYRLLFLFIPALLFSNESPFQYSDTNTDITNLESEPSSIIECVNIITGDYVECEKDMTIMGPVPMVLERSKDNSPFEGSLRGGWNHNWSKNLEVETDKESHSHKHTKVTYTFGHSEKLDFDIRKSGKQEVRIPVIKSKYEYGVTNCAKGEINGRNHIKNTEVILYRDQRQAIVKKGDGSRSIFQKEKKENFYSFDKEIFSNLNYLTHTNEKYITCDRNGKHLAYINMSGLKLWELNDTRQTIIESSDGRWVRYGYHELKYLEKVVGPDGDKDKFERKKLALNSVTRPDGPPITYKHLNMDKYNTGWVIQKSYPEHRYRITDYYLYGQDNEVCEFGKVKVKSRDDHRLGKVRRVLAPVGSTGDPRVQYQFFYEKQKHYKDREQGTTHVWNAKGHKTIYRHEKCRLTSIEKMVEGKLFTKERLQWGTGELNCNLMNKWLEASCGSRIYEKVYTYDHNHNATREVLKGNIRGDEQCDEKVKNSVYSDDGRNVLLVQEEGDVTTYHTYYPDTDLVEKKIQRGNDGLNIRQFFIYNEAAVKVAEFIDDGSGNTLEDFSNVTERRIRRIFVNEKGLPKDVFDFYWDFHEGEKLVKREVNTYSSIGRLIKQDVYDSNNEYAYSFEWDYDDMGNITRERDELGVDIHRRYDANGNLTFEQKSTEEYYHLWHYDFMNRMIASEEIYPNRKLTAHISYDLCGNKTSETDWYGNTTQFHYDQLNHLTHVSFPDVRDQNGNIIRPGYEKKYDHLGNVCEEIDSDSNVLRSKNTILGKPYTIYYADGTLEELRYDLQGRQILKRARNGAFTRYTYNSQGKIIGEDNEGGSKRSAEYNSFHKISETDPSGLKTYYSYNALGQKVKMVCGSRIENYEYDSLGRHIRTRHNHFISESDFDLKNRLTEERTLDLEGNLLSRVGYLYDSMGRQTHKFTYSDEGVSVDEKRFNSKGDMVFHKNAMGHVTTIFYDYDYVNDLGQRVPRTVMTDPMGQQLETIMDALGRVKKVEMINPHGATTQKREFAYSPSGKRVLAKETVFNGAAESIVWNKWDWNCMGHLVAVHEGLNTPEQKTTRYEYTATGKKCRVVKPDGAAINYAHDRWDRVEKIYGNDFEYHYTYDNMSRPIEVKEIFSGLTALKSFDEEHNLIKDVQMNGLEINYTWNQGRIEQYSLQDNGTVEIYYKGARFDKFIRKDQQGTEKYRASYNKFDLGGHAKVIVLPGEVKVSKSHDKLFRSISTETKEWKQNLEDFDPAGNLLSDTIIDKFTDVNRQFSYDDLYQLSSESGKFNHKYKHDSLYNLVDKDGSITEYNAVNQPINSDEEYDRNGNMVRKGDIHYRYDSLDRLVEIFGEGQHHFYSYDDQHRRMEANGTKFLYREQDEIGCYVDGKLKEFRLLGYGMGSEAGASLALEIEGNVYAPVHDHNGNIAALYNSKGELISSLHYSAFGEVEVEGISVSPWQYSGKRFDHESGLYYFGRRFYNPLTHRWLSADPIKFDGGANLYAFVMNNPMTTLDAYGLSPANGLSPGDFLKFFAWHTAEAVRQVGTICDLIGYNFIPIPLVRDVLEFPAHMLCGKHAEDYTMSYRRNHSESGTYEGTTESKKYIHYLVNGINTTRQEFMAMIKEMSDQNGGVPVHYTYNGSKGIMTDLLECGAQKLGIMMPPDQKMKDHVTQLIDQNGGVESDVKVLMLAHSQGGMLAGNLAYNLAPEYTSKIHLRTIGSASIVSDKRFGSVHNFVSRLDGVPLTDPYGYVKGVMGVHNNLTILKAEAWTFDHFYGGDTYTQTRDVIYKQFNKIKAS